jgi:hypothetical protein
MQVPQELQVQRVIKATKVFKEFLEVLVLQ